MHHDLLTMPEAAEYVGLAVATLRFYRATETGPKSFRLGKRIVYKRTDLDAWIEAAYAQAVGGSK